MAKDFARSVSGLPAEKGKMMQAEGMVQSGNRSKEPIANSVIAEQNMKRANFPMRNQMPKKNGEGLM